MAVERSGSASLQTRGELLQRVGRGALWLLVVVLLARGVVGVFAASAPVREVRIEKRSSATWPDDAARAFAADFAHAYLTLPRDPAIRDEALAAFVTPDLANSIALELEGDARTQSVTAVTVARARALDERHALITVAASGTETTRYLTVPIARDNHRGLVVDELPSFAAAPRRASLAPATLDPVDGPEEGGLRDVVSRFLRIYLAGDAAGLAYLLPAGVRLATPVARSYELVDVDSLAQIAAPMSRELQLCAIARVRDLRSGVELEQGYRLRLVRRDRWYVADVNGSREG